MALFLTPALFFHLLSLQPLLMGSAGGPYLAFTLLSVLCAIPGPPALGCTWQEVVGQEPQGGGEEHLSHGATRPGVRPPND